MVTARAVRMAVCLGIASLGNLCFANPVQFTLRGQVLSSDGKPVAGAIVEQLGVNQSWIKGTTADQEGRFTLIDGFERGVSLQARSADGREQATYALPESSVRADVAKSHEIHLSPAKAQTLHVMRNGIAVADAEVVVSGANFIMRGTTDFGGNAVVLIPANRPPRSIGVYHAQHGVGGLFSRESFLPGDAHQIELLPIAPHAIHVVDEDKKPVAGLEFSLSMGVGGQNDYGWIILGDLKSARVRTDEAGIAKVAWAPQELRVVNPHIWNDEWKPDGVDLEKLKEGVSTLKLRRKHPVSGRLIAPEGVDPTGILVTGCGFGTGSQLDLPSVRAAADGSFTLMVPAGHSYVIGVEDNQWAVDPWTGDLRTDVPADPLQVELKLYPATPLAVRVTRGPEKTPVANTYVSLRTTRRFQFTNDEGRRGNATGGLGGWLLTDNDGIARTGVALGEHEISLSDGDWTEARKLDVKSAEPVEVDFYRPWIGQRKLTGRFVDDGKPYVPSPEATLLAWSERSPRMPLRYEPRLLEDGSFELQFDSETAAIVFFDPAQERSGAIEIGLDDTDVTIKLQPTASYSGKLVDKTGRPIADQELFLGPKNHWQASLLSQQTDSSGKFHFRSVPSDVSLTARLRSDFFERQTLYIARGDRQFKPGENLEGDQLIVRNRDTTDVAKLPNVKLSESVATSCRDGRLNHMGVLVLIEGDDSVKLRDLTSRLLDGEDTPDVLAYRVISVSPERAKNEAAFIAEHKWPTASEGQAVALVLSENGQAVANVTVKAAERDESLSQARQLLAAHRPPQRDAISLLAAAQQDAKASGRRLWVVSGGPRCGPCFRLARWMDDQHALLDKDYVLVKVLGGVDKNPEAIAPLLPGSQSEGIPFHAIVEPDGKVLITSKGPLGNIGMPGDPEGVRHLRKMLEASAQKLTPEEIAQLEKSLMRIP